MLRISSSRVPPAGGREKQEQWHRGAYLVVGIHGGGHRPAIRRHFAHAQLGIIGFATTADMAQHVVADLVQQHGRGDRVQKFFAQLLALSVLESFLERALALAADGLRIGPEVVHLVLILALEDAGANCG